MNQFLPKTAPFMGLPAHMSIADIPPRSLPSGGVKALDAVTITTTSAAIAMGSRGIQVSVSFDQADGKCTLDVYKVDGTDDVLVKSLGEVANGSNTVFYLGNNERIDLEGKSVKVKVTDPVGKVTVMLQHLY